MQGQYLAALLCAKALGARNVTDEEIQQAVTNTLDRFDAVTNRRWADGWVLPNVIRDGVADDGGGGPEGAKAFVWNSFTRIVLELVDMRPVEDPVIKAWQH